MANEGKSIEEQIDGVFTVLENRLAAAGLGLDNVVQMDCLFKDINDLNVIP